MAEFQALFDYFIKNEGPWAILFVFLFFYTIKSQNTRAEKFNEETTKRLQELKRDTTIMIETWKILVERELERRKKE